MRRLSALCAAAGMAVTAFWDALVAKVGMLRAGTCSF